MSRAFVNESDSDARTEALPELPVSPHPNYVTRRGLKQLEERLAAAQGEQRRLAAAPDSPEKELRVAHVARDIRYLETRLERAIPVDAAQQPADEVAFGAVVDVVDSAGARHRFAIVGEDEADAEHGKVSWVSPLARALIGAGVGDVVQWRRPAGQVALEIEAIRYPERAS
ncbi:MAG TPA: GreA/GreB family elongation factor [Stellaceae bacterium]|jgi:transcription elongation GreA/GreB family factor|nr:GreA/GreB family elongation factor [Stellaceae bacterium]